MPSDRVGTGTGAGMLLADRYLVTRLREIGALSPATAQPLATLGRLGPLRRIRLRRLLSAGAIRESNPGACYLDEAAYAAWCEIERARIQRATRAAVALVLLLGLALLVLGR